MKDLAQEQTRKNRKLDVFLGRSHTQGNIYDAKGKVTEKVDAVDTYEWLSGKYAMIHYINTKIGETQLEGTEIIGHDPLRKAYFGPFFDNQGSVGWEEIKREGVCFTRG